MAEQSLPCQVLAALPDTPAPLPSLPFPFPYLHHLPLYSTLLSSFLLFIISTLLFFLLSNQVSPSRSLLFLAMEVVGAGLGLLGAVGTGCCVGSSGVSSSESALLEVVSEATSYPDVGELELGLGLSLGGGGWGVECGRILTAKDFPSAASQSHRPNNDGGVVAVSGTKRTADSVAHEGGSPTSACQVVGWPPIRAYRMNSLVSQAKSPRAEEDKSIGGKDKSKDGLKKKVCDGTKICSNVNEKGNLGFIKVNMDGVPIGRKVDLNAHASYQTLAHALETMFFKSTPPVNGIGKDKDQAAKPSKLLDGSSEYVLTYEDKEGDWMLVGDVPWRMFLSSVRRLRIMRTTEANGLAPPRVHEGKERQKCCKPI